MQGISTRSVDELVKALGMTGISKRQVSRLCEDIDERVGAFLSRPLEGDWPYPWIDATYVKVRDAGRIVTDQLREKVARLAAMMDEAEHEVLSFMDFPKEHRVKMHSTNVLERLNGQIKRRADVVGIFPDDNAIRRLVGALLMEQNDEYAIQKRYMSLESLATINENPAIRLPAAPALA